MREASSFTFRGFITGMRVSLYVFFSLLAFSPMMLASDLSVQVPMDGDEVVFQHIYFINVLFYFRVSCDRAKPYYIVERCS